MSDLLIYLSEILIGAQSRGSGDRALVKLLGPGWQWRLVLTADL
jgi:hypothetical protein